MLERTRPLDGVLDTDPSSVFTDEQLRTIVVKQRTTVLVEIGRPSDPVKTGTTGMPEITALLVSARAMGYSYVCIVDDPRYNKDGWPQIDMDINGFLTCSKLPPSSRLRLPIRHICVSYTNRDWKKALDKAEFEKWSRKLQQEQSQEFLVVLSCALRDVHSPLPAMVRFIQDIAENKCVIIVRNFLRASVYSRVISTVQENRASARQFLDHNDVPSDLLEPEALAGYRNALKQVARLPQPMFILQCPWLLTPCEVLTKSTPGDIQTPLDKRVTATVTCAPRGAPQPQQQTHMIAWTIPLLRCEYCLCSSRLQRCGRCGAVFYCGRACQKKHWPVHKPKCNKQ